MSVTLTPWGVSNPSPKPWVITVLVVIVITWGLAADFVSAYADVLGLLAALYGGMGCTAAKYSNHSNQGRPVQSA